MQQNELTKKPFYFIRHGRTDWNDKKLCQGQMDIPLNQEGMDEVERIGPLLSTLSFSKIITSPLLRAVETSHIIQKYCSCKIEVIEEIQERGWGTLEGACNIEMYKIEELEESQINFNSGFNIENRHLFKSRIISAINYALKGETPLIVSHGRVFLVLSELLGLTPIRQIPNSTVIECKPEGLGWKVSYHKEDFVLNNNQNI